MEHLKQRSIFHEKPHLHWGSLFAIQFIREEAQQLEQALKTQFSYFLGSKAADWEVRNIQENPWYWISVIRTIIKAQRFHQRFYLHF